MDHLSRRKARICAVRVLFGIDYHKDMDPEELFELECRENEMKYDDFTKEIFLGTCAHLEAVDEAIAKNAKGWKMERLAKMSLAILRLCTYELLFTDVPYAIAINEAVEIAKVYDNDDAPAFINGILNAIAKSKKEEKSENTGN